MSSSDKFPDWSAFSERNVPEKFELLSPASEISADLQRFSAKLKEAKEAVDKTREEILEPLAQQAVFVFKLSQALELYQADLQQISRPKGDIYRHFRVIKDQMQEALLNKGVEIIIPLGMSFDEVVDFVEIQHWRHHEDYTSETVAEVLEPIIKYYGNVIKLGRVVMGAPLEQETNS